MKALAITRTEFDGIKMLHAKENQDIPVSFSTNSSEKVWLSPGTKPVPSDKRVYVGHLSKHLSDIAKILISCRSDRKRAGGKFFLDYEGAYWKDEDSKEYRFVNWKSDDNLGPRKWTLQERIDERNRLKLQTRA